MPNHEMPEGLANVDAVIAVSSMSHDALVFFIKCVHGRPGERNASPKLVRITGEIGMLPRPSSRALIPCAHGVPGRGAEVRVPGGMVAALQSACSYVDFPEVGHR